MSSATLQTGSFNILLNGASLPSSTLAAIGDVRVEHEINVPGMFSFTLNMVGTNGNWQGVDLDTFAPGDDITILLGSRQLKRMIIGEITAIEPRFGDYSVATIRGFDRMYRLQFGTETRVFENLSDDAIVQQVARGAGLMVTTEGSTGTINTYVKQYRQSNYDFLLMRAGQIDYELTMNGTTLVFRPSAEGASPIRTLTFPKDVTTVDLDLRVPTAGSKVTVRGFNPETNEVLTAQSQGGTRRDLMGGTENGYQMAEDFPDSAITLERPDIADVKALQTIADARFQTDLSTFIEGGASLTGDPDIVAGVNLKLSGLSKRFDGIYYVTSSVHTYDDDRGYAVELKLRRSGA